jgi:sulfide:quinone oxidoreductase
MSGAKQIVIVGGGAGGIMAANRLRKALRADEARITVVERSRTHLYQPGLLTLLFGLDEQDRLSRNMSDLLRGGIDLFFDEVVMIEPTNAVVVGHSGRYRYDYLILATGARLHLDDPEGMREGLEAGKNVFHFYSLDAALKLKGALDRFEGGEIVSSICEMPIKCLAAPVEFILLAESAMKRKGIRHKCHFVFTTPSGSVPPGVEPYASRVAGLLKERGIEVKTQFSPFRVDAGAGICEDFMGIRVAFDLLCIIPPHAGVDVVSGTEGLADPMGWIMCDKNTLRHRSFKNIYALGDAGNFPSGKTASAARQQAAVLAGRITAEVRGEEPTAAYDGNTVCPILTGFDKALFAEFTYSKSLSSARESRFKWFLHVFLLRWLYWRYILRGKFFR